jgi:molybdenum cofactor guanylyltransferase
MSDFQSHRSHASPAEENDPKALFRQATAVVLAGGLSSRMGCDKAMLEIDGVSLIVRSVTQLQPLFAEVLISARQRDDYAFLNLPVVPDRLVNQGPLMAIASALEASSNDLNFFISCDVPVLPIDLIATLLREAVTHDAAVPISNQGFYEPLFAVYRKSMLAAANDALARGERSVVAMYKNHIIKPVYLENGVEIKNINTMDDYRDYRSRS